MKLRPHSHGRIRQSRGAVMIIVLLITTVSIVAMTMWLRLIHARETLVTATQGSVNARLCAQNGRFLAQGYIRHQATTASGGAIIRRGLGEYHDVDIDNSHLADRATFADGGFELTATWIGSPLAATSPGYTRNRFGPGHSIAYGLQDSLGTSTELSLRICDGRWAQTWRGAVASAPPALAGDVLVLHRDGTSLANLSGNLHVHGRLVSWHACSGDSPTSTIASSVTFDAPCSLIGGHIPDRADQDSVISNFPFTWARAWASTRLNGINALGASDVIWDTNPGSYTLRERAAPAGSGGNYTADGAVRVPESTGTPNSDAEIEQQLQNFGWASDGAGVVTVRIHTIPSKGVVITNASRLILQGLDPLSPTFTTDLAADETARGVIIALQHNDSDTHVLSTVEFYGVNARRTQLGLRRETVAAPVAMNFLPYTGQAPAAAHWRLLVFLENLASTWNLLADVNLRGGLWSTATIEAPPTGAHLHLYHDHSAEDFQFTPFVPRHVWAELYSVSEDL
jgi:hypothetical protein